MFSISAVVCATDLSEGSNKAIPLAAYIAKGFKAKLVIAHVIDLPAVTPYGETMVDPQELRARVEQSTRAQVTDILTNIEGVQWELHISIGYPAKEIQQIVSETSAGLLVAATHPRSGLERLLLGSVSRKLMFTVTVPFLIIPGDLPVERLALRQIESLMIACDFSDDSDSAVQWGLAFARTFSTKVTLATVLEQGQLNQILTVDPQKDRAIAHRLVDELAGKLQNKLSEDFKDKASTVVLAGHPHEELNKYAILNHIDLIVMGVHGRGFIENIMVGSTTDRLIRLGQFPVLAVRTESSNQDKKQ
ncbi:MAG: universal stress protein [Deltaproteobacteria bacterium]|jgi:nucleotide-binding universal stress UspA family protein|nr:universal stress protein [Deltaproteobacteria bacterium]